MLQQQENKKVVYKKILFSTLVHLLDTQQVGQQNTPTTFIEICSHTSLFVQPFLMMITPLVLLM